MSRKKYCCAVCDSPMTRFVRQCPQCGSIIKKRVSKGMCGIDTDSLGIERMVMLYGPPDMMDNIEFDAAVENNSVSVDDED